MNKIQFKVAKQFSGYAVVLNSVVEAECQTKKEATELAKTWNIANRWTDNDWAARKNAEKLSLGII